MSDPAHTLPRMRHHTSPLVVAVTYPQHGHTWAGRVATWELRDGVWWAHILGEYGNHKAGAGGGWIRADELEPAQHEVRTTHGGWEWGTWVEQPWPEGLERFAEAANNLAQRPARQHDDGPTSST